MPITSAELIKYGAASRPEDDTSASGGAIDTLCTLDVTQLAANDNLEALSDNAADTMNLDIYGRDAAGARVNEVRALNGTTVVSFVTNTLERFLRAALASAPAGNVTIRRAGAGATVAVIPAGMRYANTLFIDSSSEAATTVRYEKEFWKNTDPALTLNAAKLQLTADPDTSIEIGMETTKNGTGSVTNRKTAPGGVSFVDDAIDINLPGTTLEAGSAIGLWVKMTRGASAAPLKSSYTTQIAGTTV